VEEARLVNIIVSIQVNYKELLEREIVELRGKLEGIDEKQMQLIEKSFTSFAKSFIHHPITQLKDFIREYREK
jgi:glutamyl-tRNA reductase